jgi:hypothetical protein
VIYLGVLTEVRGGATIKPHIVWSPYEMRFVMAEGYADNKYWMQQFPRWSGAAAMLGGLLCAVAAFLHNLEPIGCIGLECETRAMRSGTGIVALAGSAAALLILVGIAGLTVRARQSGRHTKLADTALVFAAFGFVLLFLGTFIQAVFFNGNFPGMPYLGLPGVLAVIVGFVLIGILILRSEVLPRWLGVFLLVSSIALLAANEQTVTVLLAIPFGFAIATAGYFMWSGAAKPRGVPV